MPQRFAMRLGMAAVAVALLAGCTAPFALPARTDTSGSSSPTQTPGVAGAATGPDAATETKPPTPRPITQRLYTQDEVSALAGSIVGPDGHLATVLDDDDFWDQNQSVHFGAYTAEVSPKDCSNQLGWATLTADGLPAAGSFTGTEANPAFVAVSADRNDALALSFEAISRLDRCSPLTLTYANETATVEYRRASAFSDAGMTYAVIGTITPPSGKTKHVLRVAGKIGTLFVQASANISNPDDYRADADRLSGFINQVAALASTLPATGILPAPDHDAGLGA